MNSIILCCGGRQLMNRDFVFVSLDTVLQSRGASFAIVEGGARGADRLSREWALSRQVPFFTCPAHWETLRTQAGPVRNQWMLHYAQPFFAVAFPGGSGTRDMVARLKAAAVPVWEPKP